jgi:cell division protein FtsA
VVNEGGVEGTKMFGIGGRAFTHSIERELDVDFVKAEAVKLSLATAAPKHKEEAEKALAKTLRVWTNGVELALSEFTKMDHLPHRLLLCGGGSSLQPLMDTLQDTDWYKTLPFTKKPLIQHIKPDEVVGITDSTGNITDHTYITAMGLLRVGMDTLTSGVAEGDNTIRNKLNRILRV